ncbi:hypothetical protein Tco_0685693 [Tanacetum coccineum]
MLPSTGRVSSTNASGSNPKSNTKNDRIPQPSSRSKKNKVEARHRKFKSSANKNNHVSNSNHDAYVVQYLKKMQKHKVAKSAKQKVKSEWKPIGRIFKTVVVPPGHILTTTVIPVDVPLSHRYANVRESLSKCMLNMEFHPFNLHDFGFEGIIQDDELPPWKFDYLGIVEIVFWYLDSGCSKHITRHRDKLINFVSKFIGTVRFGNDHFAAIMGYEDLQMGNNLISRVYYVEGLGHNLFPVGQFCDSDLEVAFRKHTCFVRNLEGVDLLSSSRGSNLYTISMADI